MYSLACSIFGHTETKTEYHWDIPLYPSHIDDQYKDSGFASYKWEKCKRCNQTITKTLIKTEDAPSPIKTAPLL